ncbi:hypothetical protein [Streptomyces sp. BK239]|uniref:hypothetical protein n=1 Tax=Streptomyces sp. BK239 TaxID=2512155 RepID=UPI0010E082CF|nr:hypothetical protein [Streptomyces sp. BK239]RZU17119.1 hypothetical protein EV567_3556 [Streptomyces sp. BK239]
MIYRHHIAPPRAYTQFSHDIIRHPRLSSDAVRLLTWQLSLPQGAREPLSRTAERANIGACAFSRAKRQLKEEGFVHERRVQGSGGHWATQQLVSNVPLSAAEAAKLLGRMPVAGAAPEPVSPQVAPSPLIPAVGDPTPRLSDGHPKKDLAGNTSDQPPEPPVQPGPEPAVAAEPETDAPPEILSAATDLVAGFPRLSPALRHVPRPMHAELTRLTARWLEAGHPPSAVRIHILRGLPDDTTPVHRPGGLLRHLLREVPPVPEPTPPRPAPDPLPPTPAAGPRLSARLTGAVECQGPHTQPMLFRPTAGETLCPRCATGGRLADVADRGRRAGSTTTLVRGVC